MQLRDYQRQCVIDIVNSYKDGSKRVLLVVPTGGGKTVIMGKIVQGAQSKGTRSCIIEHRQELILQTCITLARWGIKHRIIAPSKLVREAMTRQLHTIGAIFHDDKALVSLASVQTLSRKEGERFDFLLFDEAHHLVKGNTWGKVFEASPNAKILGVTATPLRLDGKGLGEKSEGFFDSMVEGPTISELIDQGFLTKPIVYGPSREVDLSSIKTRAGDFAQDQAEKAFNTATITGDAVEHYKRLSDGIPAIAFCVTVAHAEAVAESFRQAGYRAQCVDGSMQDSARMDAIAGLGNGKVQILTSCEIISEGTDIPVVGCGIMLRPTKSLSLYLQQAGRCLRAYDGKTSAIILDHAGNCLMHGLPDDIRSWSLEGGRKSEGDGRQIQTVKACKECHNIFPSSIQTCPECGAKVSSQAREIEVEAGDLKAFSRYELEAQRQREIEERRKEQGRARTLEDMIELGKRRGYPNPAQWARKVIQSRKRG